MTQVWKGENVIPVTRLQAGPCVVVQVKTKDKDNYRAVQLAFAARKEKNMSKSVKGHLKKLGIEIMPKYLREFRLDGRGKEVDIEMKPGDIIDVSTFAPGDIVKVTGTSKGKGFQGVVRRHGFSGSKKTHGNKDQERMPGSSGATGPQHVFKGSRMPGRMGGDRVSVTNLEIVEVDKENNRLLVKGAVPGARNGLVLISGPGELKIKEKGKSPETAAEKEPAAEEVKPKDEGGIAKAEAAAPKKNKN